MSRRFRLLGGLTGVLIGAFIGIVLAGCGQTGPLYLPDPDPEVVGPPAETSTTATPADPEADPDANRKRPEVQPLPAPQ
jgi:predicted small lipoprotein YifL